MIKALKLQEKCHTIFSSVIHISLKNQINAAIKTKIL